MKVSMAIVIALVLLGNCAEARMLTKCNAFEPMVDVAVTDSEIATSGPAGATTRARIIQRGHSANDLGTRYFRTWSKDGGIGVLIIRRAAQCSESDVDPKHGLFLFIHVRQDFVIDGCCDGLPGG